MKKALLFTLIIVIICPGIVWGQEANDLSSPGWDYYINDYNKNQINQPVTVQEYNKALETVKGYQKNKDKKEASTTSKRKWWFWGKKKQENKDADKAVKNERPKVREIPASSDPLLRLPYDVYSNGAVIQNGFYLVDTIMQNNKHYIRLKQGGQNIYVIEASQTSASTQEITSPTVTFQVADNKFVKIQYQSKTSILESILPIYK